MKKIAIVPFLLFLGLVVVSPAMAHESTITIDRIGGIDVTPGGTPLVVPYLPFTFDIEGTVTHEGNGNLNKLEFRATDNGELFYGPTYEFRGSGASTTAAYTIPWTIKTDGFHLVSIYAEHESNDREPGCKAAPSIANEYMKENNVPRKNEDGDAIIPHVAKETGKKGELWAKESCTDDYVIRTIEFVVETQE